MLVIEGSFPDFALEGRVDDVLEKLMSCLAITKETEKWAEGRRDAVKAITDIVKTVGVRKGSSPIDKDKASRVLSCLLSAFDDYTLDRRGDIGAWVREAAMQGVADLLVLLLEENLVPEERVAEVMPRLAQQACEKIDRTRGLAARLFVRLLTLSEPRPLPGIPRRKELLALLPNHPPIDPATFQWRAESETFPIFTSMLPLKEYRCVSKI